MKAVISLSSDWQYYCTLVSRNGQVLFTSKTYKRKASLLKMLKRNFGHIKIVDHE